MIVAVKIVSQVKDWPRGVFRVEGSSEQWTEHKIEIRIKENYQWSTDDGPAFHPTIPLQDVISALQCAFDLGYTHTPRSYGFFEDNETYVYIIELLKSLK